MTKKRLTSQQIRAQTKKREESKKAKRNQSVAVFAAVLIVIAGGILIWQLLGTNEPGQEQEAKPLSGVAPADRFGYYEEYPPMTIDTNLNYEAVLKTEKGDIRIRLFDDEAPLAVNNFVFLANQGFYDGLTFHRVIADFMAQGGDPTGQGFGGPGYQFADEVDNDLSFDRPGMLAMANSGPDTNGSQFFITYVPTSHLDGLHTIFGELIEGQEVLDSLTLVQPGGNGDVIESVDIIVN